MIDNFLSGFALKRLRPRRPESTLSGHPRSRRWTSQLAIHSKIFPVPVMKERDLLVASFCLLGSAEGARAAASAFLSSRRHVVGSSLRSKDDRSLLIPVLTLRHCERNVAWSFIGPRACCASESNMRPAMLFLSSKQRVSRRRAEEKADQLMFDFGDEVYGEARRYEREAYGLEASKRRRIDVM